MNLLVAGDFFKEVDVDVGGGSCRLNANLAGDGGVKRGVGQRHQGWAGNVAAGSIVLRAWLKG